MKIAPIDYAGLDYNPSAQYPYGTRIELTGDLAVGAGFEKYKAGDTVEVRAIAVIREKSEEAKIGDDGKSTEIEKELCLQLTDIELKKTKADVVKQLYGDK